MKSKAKNQFFNYFWITIGLFLNALAWTAFLIPAKIVGGGISGIGTLIFYAFGNPPVGITVLAVNALLVLIAVKILGASFGVKTIYGVVVLSLFLSILQKVFDAPVVSDAFMAAILGGIIAGVGIGLTFSYGGTTGGTDIIAMIIMKYKNYSPGKILLTIDVFIIMSSYLVFGSLEKIVYGYVTMAVCGYAIDMFLEGSKQSLQVFIFSQKFAVIADRINQELNRGVTVLNGQGWYSKQDVQVLMIILRKSEIEYVLRIIKEEDSNSFMSMNSVMGVFGRGFDRIKI